MDRTWFRFPARSLKSTSSSSRDERFQGHDSYRISFKPADKEDLDWAGEAYIDANGLKPIHVLFFYNRQAMVLMNNKDLEQTHVETKITAEAPSTER